MSTAKLLVRCECRKLEAEKKEKPYEAVYYKKKYFEFLRQKKGAFIIKEKDWAVDGDNSDDEIEYINLALLAKSDEQIIILLPIR